MNTHDHWEHVHATKGADVSWWQDEQDLWLDLITELDLEPDDPIVDVGSGSSPLVDALHALGYRDLTAVDVSRGALDRVAGRLGDSVHLVHSDVLDFRAEAPVRLWHDRAVFHFLTDSGDRACYRENLHDSLRPDGYAIVATFAPDGPETCSGLPVRRYGGAELAAELGLDLVFGEHRIHTTPWNSQQPFTIAVLQP